MANHHILILGAGSIGRRHARNFASLGCRVSCFDPRQDRIDELADETSVEGGTTNIDEAFRMSGVDGVVVASPTAYHPGQAIRAMRAGLPVLLEKPAAKTLSEAADMLAEQQRTGIAVLLGYTWRWWPPLLRVRELLKSGVVGRILHMQFHMSAHLADWHPWERYQDFFMASTELGGGALLDESHWIDLMLWLFGMPAGLYGHVEKNSGLEIETDDNVDVLVDYPDGKRATLHLDLYGRPHEKYIRFIGEEGTLLWTAEPNRISVGHGPEPVWDATNYECERNDMFMGVATAFCDMVQGGSTPACTLQDGVGVMTLIEAIRKSSQQKAHVRL